MHSQNKLYSLEVLNQNTTDTQVQKLLEAKDEMLDVMGVI